MSVNERALLTLAAEDNVSVACVNLDAGERVEVDGCPVVLSERIPLGHKLARRPIRRGEPVLKYGAPIGSATADIARGDLVHDHNLASDYYPSHTHEAARAAAGVGED
jgi:hypothetical protein